MPKTLHTTARKSTNLVVFEWKPLSQKLPMILLFSSFVLSGWLAANSLGLTDKLFKKIVEIYGTDAKDRLLSWQSVIYSNKTEVELAKLERVNAFFNKSEFVDDIDHWNVEDYWATPVEFLSTNGGDCEDFSIAKYFTLREMGVPIEKMRIMYVKAIELDQAHMVLAYYPTPDAEPVILDNLIAEIKLASIRTDLVPIYSFNGDGLWLSKERGKGRRVGSSKRIKLWQDLGQRLRKQIKQDIALEPKDVRQAQRQKVLPSVVSPSINSGQIHGWNW